VSANRIAPGYVPAPLRPRWLESSAFEWGVSIMLGGNGDLRGAGVVLTPERLELVRAHNTEVELERKRLERKARRLKPRRRPR
jgi:hypothetical protein